MKAIIRTEYGSPEVLQMVEIEKPSPAAGEVLVKVHAASINMADRYLMTGKPLMARLTTGGLLRPKSPRLGADVAGEVVEVGRDVGTFKPGDAVFADLAACGFGGFSEYVAVPEKYLARMPANLSYEQAAAVPMAAVTAWQAIRDAGPIEPGAKVLIVGASGGVGTYLLQMVKAAGAHVTAVCSTKNVELVRSLGADRVIDYTREDFTGDRYDLIFAANGNRSLADFRRALVDGGVLVVTGGSLSQIFRAMLLGSTLGGGKKASALSARPSGADLAAVAEMIAAGAVSPVIDATYPLADIAAAMRYLENEHPRGKVILKVNGAHS